MSIENTFSLRSSFRINDEKFEDLDEIIARYIVPMTLFARDLLRHKYFQYLLSRGADVNVCDQFLWTPLQLVAYFGYVEILKLLVDAGAPTDAQALNGATPLMRAIQACNLSCVDFLIQSASTGGAVYPETSTATAGKSFPQRDSKSIILQNTRIATGRTNTVDITFVPKTVWGKPPTTSQLMSKIEKRRELLSLELDFDDFMMPFNQNIQRKVLEPS